MFYEAYVHVESILTDTLKYKITGRPSKSTVAVVDKLKRESIRLSQMQDIAGCRIVAPNIESQNIICDRIILLLGNVVIDDKRMEPVHGYRAVHLIYKHHGRPVEIQVRTKLQHIWSEISEKISDIYGHSIKYGIGEDWAIEFLSNLAEATRDLEEIQLQKTQISRAKVRYGKNKRLIDDNKFLNRRHRDCLKRIKSLFDSLRSR